MSAKAASLEIALSYTSALLTPSSFSKVMKTEQGVVSSSNFSLFSSLIYSSICLCLSHYSHLTASPLFFSRLMTPELLKARVVTAILIFSTGSSSKPRSGILEIRVSISLWIQAWKLCTLEKNSMPSALHLSYHASCSFSRKAWKNLGSILNSMA